MLQNISEVPVLPVCQIQEFLVRVGHQLLYVKSNHQFGELTLSILASTRFPSSVIRSITYSSLA
jgi:hypothetical protein